MRGMTVSPGQNVGCEGLCCDLTLDRGGLSGVTYILTHHITINSVPKLKMIVFIMSISWKRTSSLASCVWRKRRLQPSTPSGCHRMRQASRAEKSGSLRGGGCSDGGMQ